MQEEFRIRDPETGDEITTDFLPTKTQAGQLFAKHRKEKALGVLGKLSDKDLLTRVESDPTLPVPEEVQRRVYNAQQAHEYDWLAVASETFSAIPDAMGQMIAQPFRAAGELGAELGRASVEDKVQPTVNPLGLITSAPFVGIAGTEMGGKIANTVAESGLRMGKELWNLPPRYAAQRAVLDSRIKSFGDFQSKKISDYFKRKPKDTKIPQQRGMQLMTGDVQSRPPVAQGWEQLKRENPARFAELKQEHDDYVREEKFKNWQKVWLEKRADAAKAMEVQAGETSYLSEASGGKANLEALTGSGEVLNEIAQSVTDYAGPDIPGMVAISRVTSKMGRPVTGAMERVTGAVDKAGAGLEKFGQATRKMAGENAAINALPTALTAGFQGLEQITETVAKGAKVLGGAAISPTLRKARTATARRSLSAVNNKTLEGILHRTGKALDEGAKGMVAGAGMGAVMGIGADTDREFGRIVGSQAGVGAVISGGLSQAQFRQRQDAQLTTEALNSMSPENREGLVADRVARLQKRGVKDVRREFDREMAGLVRIQNEFAADGVEIRVETPEKIYADAIAAGSTEAVAKHRAAQQGYINRDIGTGQRTVVINSAASADMTKTAMHESMHSVMESDATTPPGIIDRIRGRETGESFADKTGTLYTDTFGFTNERGERVVDGALSQAEGEAVIDAYLARLYRGDLEAINDAKSVDGRPMTYQELVDTHGGELFTRIAEDFAEGGDPVANVSGGMVVNAVRRSLGKMRAWLEGRGVDPDNPDALDTTARNPVVRDMVRKYLKDRTQLKTEMSSSNQSRFIRSISPKRLTRGGGKKAVENAKRYAGTGMFKLDENGNPLNTNGEVFQGRQGEKLAVLSRAAQNRRRKVAASAMFNALDALGDQDGGMFRRETARGGTEWRGVPNEAQMDAILSLPDTVVPRNLKDRLRTIVETLRKADGETIGIDYNKALTGKAYDTLASMEYRAVAPFGLFITQAGNFNAALFDVGKFSDKIDQRKANNPKWFDDWGGVEGFVNEVKGALARQRNGEPNTGKNTKGLEKIKQFLNVDRLDANTSDAPTGLIRSFRLDRMNEITRGLGEGYRINYDRYGRPETFQTKGQPRNFQPAEAAQRDADHRAAVERGDMETAQRLVDEAAKAAGLTRAYHGSPDFVGTQFDKKFQGRNSALSRGGFSFSFDRASAEAYAQVEAEPEQAMVDKANEAVSELASLDPQETWSGPNAETWGTLVFNANNVDDVAGFGDYLVELSQSLKSGYPTVAKKLREAAEVRTGDTNPQVIDAFIGAFDVQDVRGRKVAIVNDPNQIKSADPATYDDAGNLVPLSERFNSKSEDIRFQPSEAGPLPDRIRALDAVGSKKRTQVGLSIKDYAPNPIPDSVVLPPRMGLINRKVAGVPNSTDEVAKIVTDQVDRILRVANEDPEFAKRGGHFYRDMAEVGFGLADTLSPPKRSQYDTADMMLRILALGSPRSSVSSNSTKSSRSVGGSLNLNAGFKIGTQPGQLGAQKAAKDWSQGQHFDVLSDEAIGADDKVRNFYLNSMADLIDMAILAGDDVNANMLITRAAKSLGLIEPTESLSPEMRARTLTFLDGLATVDMWDMAAKGYAHPAWVVPGKVRGKGNKPFQWSVPKQRVKAQMKGRYWNRALKETEVVEEGKKARPAESPMELDYQYARAFLIDGRRDWNAKNWEERKAQGFTEDTEWSYFKAPDEGGLSPGGGGPVYDAQQAIDGLIADELNRRGMAEFYGVEKLKARNAQEIIWANEKRDNPVVNNRKLELFGDRLGGLVEAFRAMREQGDTAVSVSQLAENALNAVRDTYAKTEDQALPIKIVSAGTTKEARTIQSREQEIGAEDLTRSVAAGLMTDLQKVLDAESVPVTVRSVDVSLGGYLEGESANVAPNMVIGLRGDPAQTRSIMESLSVAWDQDGGNIIRRPTVEEFASGKKLNKALVFKTGDMSAEAKSKLYEDLAKLKDENGETFLTGFTSTAEGMFIGDQFYGGNLSKEHRMNRKAIDKIAARHGVEEIQFGEFVIETYERPSEGDRQAKEKTVKADGWQRRIIEMARRRVANARSGVPTAGQKIDPVKRVDELAERMESFTSKTARTGSRDSVKELVDIAALDRDISPTEAQDKKAELDKLFESKPISNRQKELDKRLLKNRKRLDSPPPKKKPRKRKSTR